MNKKIVAAICLILTVHFSMGQAKSWNSPKNNTVVELAQWEVGDLIYPVKVRIDDPLKKQVFAVVTSNNETQKIPMFYNGDNQWVFRYSSATAGVKSFVIESEIKELNGKKGKISVVKNTKSDRHGGIVLRTDNPQHFFYEESCL